MIRNLLLASVFATTGLIAVTADVPRAPEARALDDAPWTLPEMPPRCTEAQADSGDVAGCLLARFRDPADDGYGEPPAPGVGDGWEWNGYTFNRSPALANWEATAIAANTRPVAGLPAGTLETHVEARVLFEGFLTEIDAAGYRVRGASGYSYRCSSGNGGWDCPSGDRTDLSLHAYGLAIDMNSGTNPIATYTGVDGATACKTPIVTDFPRSVVQIAEKWGLYWGGYGWSTGCQTVETTRTSVYRDPPHFEFRGSPAQARAIASFNGAEVPSETCPTMFDDAGHEIEACTAPAKPAATTRLPVDPDAPDGTEAALINLTATGADAAGFLTIESCGPQARVRTTSALTFAPGQAAATMAVVPLDADGRFCIYRSAAVHSIVDVVGFIGPDSSTTGNTDAGLGPDPSTAVGGSLWVEAVTPERLTDTREGGACATLSDCRPGPVPAGSEIAVPVGDAATRIANLAAVQGSAPGYLQAGRCDGLGTGAEFSNLNYGITAPRSNLAVIGGGDAGSCVFALTRTHVLVDELARLDPEQGLGWRLVEQRRVLDTRQCTATWCDGRPDDGQLIRIPLDTDADAAVVAVTVTRPQGRGFASVGRCSELASGEPTTSNVNYTREQTVTNLALVGLEAGDTCVFTHTSAHLVVDVQAELVGTHEIGVVATAPMRVHDSRKLWAR